MNTLAGQPKKEDSFVSRRVAGQIIIVPIRSNLGDLESIYTLNEAATLIWEMIDGETRADRIAEKISEQYEVSLESAERDVLEFLDTLESAGFVKVASCIDCAETLRGG